MGYKPIALEGKRPIEKGWQLMEITREKILEMFPIGTQRNIGNRCDGLTTLDFDEKEPARKFWSEWYEMLKTIVETRKGIHVYFQAETRNAKFKYGDIRSGCGGQVVAEGSVVVSEDGPWMYRTVKGHGRVPVEELPRLQDGMVEPKSRPSNGPQKAVTNARSYIAKITSVQGENGSAGLCRAVQACIRAGLGEAETMRELLEWNSSGAAVPPWSLDEITHAVMRVHKQNGK